LGWGQIAGEDDVSQRQAEGRECERTRKGGEGRKKGEKKNTQINDVQKIAQECSKAESIKKPKGVQRRDQPLSENQS